MNLLPVSPMKGRTALASRCLRSPLFDEPTWEKLSRKSCEGCGDFTTDDNNRVGDEGEKVEEDVWALLHSSPSQPER